MAQPKAEPDWAELARTAQPIELENEPNPWTEPGRFLGLSDVFALQPLEWLVDQWIPERGLVVLWGKWGSGKTFVALDLAGAVALGESWYGHNTRQGDVLYMAAEGVRGIRDRLEAWWTFKHRNRTNLPGLLLANEDDYPPVNFMDQTDVGLFLEAIAGRNLRLIVVDTLARHMVHGDENSARDMGSAIAQLDRIRKATGAAVVLVHHPDKAEQWARGSGALPGATDAEIKLKATAGGVVLEQTKQKDGKPAPPLHLAFHVVDLDNGRQSPVLVARDPATNPWDLPESAVVACRLLAEVFEPNWPTSSQWRTVYLDETGHDNSTFYRAKKTLLDLEFVTQEGGTGTTRRGATYPLTDEGKDAVGRILANTSHDPNATNGHLLAGTVPPLRGTDHASNPVPTLASNEEANPTPLEGDTP